MALAANEVVVRTITTNELNADNKKHPWPVTFRRVVGIDTPGGLVVCKDVDEATRQSAQPEVLRLRDEAQTRKLCQYFAEVIALNDIRLLGNKTRPEADYTCHSAAEFIAGTGGRMLGREAVNFVRRKYLRRGGHVEVSPPYGIGDLGFVMGHDQEEPTFGIDVRHSFIGLGPESEECLSVLCIGGPLAFVTYEDTFRREWGWGRRLDDEEGEELTPYFACPN